MDSRASESNFEKITKSMSRNIYNDHVMIYIPSRQEKMHKKAKSEPRDPQKPKIYEKTIALDPTRPRESFKKVCFDPVKVGRIHSIIYNTINCIIYYIVLPILLGGPMAAIKEVT